MNRTLKVIAVAVMVVFAAGMGCGEEGEPCSASPSSQNAVYDLSCSWGDPVVTTEEIEAKETDGQKKASEFCASNDGGSAEIVGSGSHTLYTYTAKFRCTGDEM